MLYRLTFWNYSIRQASSHCFGEYSDVKLTLTFWIGSNASILLQRFGTVFVVSSSTILSVFYVSNCSWFIFTVKLLTGFRPLAFNYLEAWNDFFFNSNSVIELYFPVSKSVDLPPTVSQLLILLALSKWVVTLLWSPFVALWFDLLFYACNSALLCLLMIFTLFFISS